MKVDLVEKLWDPKHPQANYEGVYKFTELIATGTASYENNNREQFTARAMVCMYGTISMRVTVRHPVSLTSTDVCVKLNKAAFEKTGIDYRDMDAVMPHLIDHVSKKRYGYVISRCTNVELNELYRTDASEFFASMTCHELALEVWRCMRHDYQEFTIKREYAEGRYIPIGAFNEFVNELKGMGASISGFAPGKYVTIQA